LDLRRLRCALGGHEYRYEGIMLGNRIERSLRCGNLRTGPTSEPATIHRLPTGRKRQHNDSDSEDERA
jgi:hypothetical protein